MKKEYCWLEEYLSSTKIACSGRKKSASLCKEVVQQIIARTREERPPHSCDLTNCGIHKDS